MNYSRDVELPLDILHYLIERVLPDHLSPIPLTRTLRALCLVSHSFLSIAQPVLYHTPFLSFDPPDTTPPGRTHTRICRLISTLDERDDLRRQSLKSLVHLGQWSTRCLSEGIPDRRQVSKLFVKLTRLVILGRGGPGRGGPRENETTGTNLRVFSFPFVTESDKREFLEIFASAAAAERGEKGRLREIRFGEGGAYEHQDPWIINLDPRVREEWGAAKFTIGDLKTLADRSEWVRGVKTFRLMARLRVEDPLEDDDPLVRPLPSLRDGEDEEEDDQLEKEEEEEEERFSFKLEEFELNLLRNSKVSFNYLDRILRSSLSTLTTLILKEHQFESRDTLFRFLETYGARLTKLSTTSANQHEDNFQLVQLVSKACPRLKELSIGSPTKRERPLMETLETLVDSRVGQSLERFEITNCYSLSLFPLNTITTATTTMEQQGGGGGGGGSMLSEVLVRFRNLEQLSIGPQHDSIEDGYEQERNVARHFRDLDGTVATVEVKQRGRRRRIRSKVSFWRWEVEIER